MKKLLIFSIILFTVFSCDKNNIKPSETTIFGTWELIEYNINGDVYYRNGVNCDFGIPISQDRWCENNIGRPCSEFTQIHLDGYNGYAWLEFIWFGTLLYDYHFYSDGTVNVKPVCFWDDSGWEDLNYATRLHNIYIKNDNELEYNLKNIHRQPSFDDYLSLKVYYEIADDGFLYIEVDNSIFDTEFPTWKTFAKFQKK